MSDKKQEKEEYLTSLTSPPIGCLGIAEGSQSNTNTPGLRHVPPLTQAYKL